MHIARSVCPSVCLYLSLCPSPGVFLSHQTRPDVCEPLSAIQTRIHRHDFSLEVAVATLPLSQAPLPLASFHHPFERQLTAYWWAWPPLVSSKPTHCRATKTTACRPCGPLSAKLYSSCMLLLMLQVALGRLKLGGSANTPAVTVGSQLTVMSEESHASPCASVAWHTHYSTLLFSSLLRLSLYYRLLLVCHDAIPPHAVYMRLDMNMQK